MPKIFELDPHVADLIAAGEVVERPASVVKELMENSIDAGAGIVTIEITAGGMTYIRVTDNGCGISPEDARTAFLRHATSKLRGADGLESIGTLGFRGEALAAIAAVSRIELLTREQGSDEGISLSLEAGEVRGHSPAGCPEGTTLIIRDLFFNTPARLKFMKSDRAESSAVTGTVLRSALSRPEVSVRFIRDGRTEYHTPGDSRADSCIYSLLGREFSAELLEARSSFDSLSVTGYVSAPSAARGNRGYQFFFVNGRPIRSLTLQAALEQAFSNTLPGGRFPSCVLYLSTGLGNVDVNVHPAKTEVKFISDKQFFDGVLYAARGALERARDGAPHVARTPQEAAAASLIKHTPQTAGMADARSDARPDARLGSLTGPLNDGRSGDGVRRYGRNSDAFRTMQVGEYQKVYGTGGTGGSDGSDKPISRSQPDAPPEAGPDDRASYPDALTGRAGIAVTTPPVAEINNSDIGNSEIRLPGHDFRIIGEALGTYIVIEHHGGVCFIDKHAAHERIHFDALKRSGFEPMSQVLITPLICRLGHDGVAILLENTGLLDRLGFSVEAFGDDTLAVRQIPAEIDIGDAEASLSEICVELGRGGVSEPVRLDNIYRMVACKASIKAGSATELHELKALAARVVSGEISHCPHGRPVMFELARATLEKAFKRA